MKKTQKKLGNKGFSLVELIVVIAIMAVLVGVLAPTNVEKSRESTDIQTLDSIKSSVVTALSTEACASNLPESGISVITYNEDGTIACTSNTALQTALNTEMTADNSLNAKMKSKKGAAGTVYIVVNSAGSVKAGVYSAAPTDFNTEAVDSTYLKDSSNNAQKLIAQ